MARGSIVLLVTWMLIVTALPSAPASAASDDCQSGQDAPADILDSIEVATPRRCAASIGSALDRSDAYGFHAEQGDKLRIGLVSLDRVGFFICIYGPSDPVYQARFCQNGSYIWDHQVVANETGMWRIRIQAAYPASYELAISREHEAAGGMIALGVPSPLGVNELAGPGSPAVDGVWVALPARATGNESATLGFHSWFNVQGASLTFYTAEFQRQVPDYCLPDGLTDTCAVPAGAEWAHIRAFCCIDVSYRFNYYY